MIPIDYTKLFALIKTRGKNEYYLRKNGISSSILEKLKKGTGGIDARSIEKLCKLLDCQPGDKWSTYRTKPLQRRLIALAMPQGRNDYTFADYLAWDGEGHIEIMDGQIIMMAPPSRIHQEISVEITRQLANYLEGKKCKVYHAPFAVRLFEGAQDKPDDVQTVFEPDIAVICDMDKLDDKGCKGAPDMVVEILSPSSARYDLLFKMHRYEKAGVQEYWIISPKEQTVQVFTINDGRFQVQEVYSPKDIAKVNVLQGCFIELSRVFPEEG